MPKKKQKAPRMYRRAVAALHSGRLRQYLANLDSKEMVALLIQTRTALIQSRTARGQRS